MNAKTLLTIALVTVLAGCGKNNGSSDASKATVNFQALAAGSDVVAVTFQAYSAQDPSKAVAREDVHSFDATASAGRAFSGQLLVDPGQYVFRAKAFDQSNSAVGEGVAEDARPVAVTKAGKTSIAITIVPYQRSTTGPAVPVITSFVVSPTGKTVLVNTPVTMGATVDYRGTSKLTYRWEQSCANGVFSTPTDGLSATWSDPMEETCTLTFTVTDPVSGSSDSHFVSLQCSCLGTSQLTGQALVVCE